MTFGLEYGDVVEHTICPRCGAPAYVRARIRKTTNLYENHLTCGKCHKIKFTGMTSIDYMVYQRMLMRLIEKMKRARTHREKERISSRISEVKERMKIYELVRFPD